MKNSKIQDIITKSILEEASSEELVMLEKWRSDSSQNENLYQEYSLIWDKSANYEAVDFQPNVESAYQKHLNLLSKEETKVVDFIPKTDTFKESEINQTKTKLFTLRRIASIAALFVVVFGAMVVFNSMSSNSISADNGVKYVSLDDGSSIWLDEGSTLSYSSGFGEDHRNLKLEGKAFFDVTRNENIPFNIASNDIDVSVLGTSFTIDTKQGKNIVAVKTGKVSVKAENKELILLADEKAIFENNTFTQLSSNNTDMVWRNSKLSFQNAPIDQVISDINLFHNNKIVVKNDIKNLDCPFTAKSLANTSFENIIKILKITYDLEAENEEEGKISLTISECK